MDFWGTGLVGSLAKLPHGQALQQAVKSLAPYLEEYTKVGSRDGFAVISFNAMGDIKQSSGLHFTCRRFLPAYPTPNVAKGPCAEERSVWITWLLCDWRCTGPAKRCGQTLHPTEDAEIPFDGLADLAVIV